MNTAKKIICCVDFFGSENFSLTSAKKQKLNDAAPGRRYRTAIPGKLSSVPKLPPAKAIKVQSMVLIDINF